MSTEPTIPRQPIRPTRFIATRPIYKVARRSEGGPRDYNFASAAATAAPIAWVPTLLQPSDQMSPVRRPWSSTALAALSMASGAVTWFKLERGLMDTEVMGVNGLA